MVIFFNVIKKHVRYNVLHIYQIRNILYYCFNCCCFVFYILIYILIILVISTLRLVRYGMEGVIKKFKFQTPTSVAVIGASGSGKTQFIFNILDNKDKIFEIQPKGILYCYTEYQEIFDKYKEYVQFFKGVPTKSDLDKFRSKLISRIDKNPHIILILDDLMLDINIDVCKLITIYSHHNNISVFLILHNLFFQHKLMRSIILSIHYYVIFGIRRDVSQIRYFSNQLFNDKKLRDEFLDLYKETLNTKYGYLLIELHPGQCYRVAIRQNIFPHEIETVFLPKE